MSQSTIIVVEIGLDKFELFCGSREPAELLGIEVGKSRTYYGEAASIILGRMPSAGAGRQTLFTAILRHAYDNRELHAGERNWLRATISRYD